MKKYRKRILLNRGYSESTANNYCRTVEKFDEFLNKISFGKRGVNNPESITVKDIDSFIKNERIKGKNISTCNNYIAGIKLWLKYNLIIGKKVEDYRKILLAREPQRKIESLNEEDSKRLLEYFKSVDCETRKEEVIKTRNLLICHLLIYTGLRVSELTNLKIEDIQEELQIIGKGGKRRVVYLFKEDLALIDLYLFLRKDKSPYLLVSHSSNYKSDKLSSVSIENIIRKGGKRIGIKVFPHKLRHTFATNLLKNGAKLPYIQNLLGHTNISTTQAYLSVRNSDLKDTQQLLKRF